MKNFYDVGKVYIWQNCFGQFAYLNGQETTVTGDARNDVSKVDDRVYVGQMTDTPARQYPGFFLDAEPGDLRPKNPPPGEQSIADLFKLPELEPA